MSVWSRLPYLLTMAAGLDFVMKCQGHSRSERFPKKKTWQKTHSEFLASLLLPILGLYFPQWDALTPHIRRQAFSPVSGST